jgi:hypothetical protein
MQWILGKIMAEVEVLILEISSMIERILHQMVLVEDILVKAEVVLEFVLIVAELGTQLRLVTSYMVYHLLLGPILMDQSTIFSQRTLILEIREIHKRKCNNSSP